MSTLETLFGTATLDLVVPDTSIEYPPNSTTDDWLSRIKSGKTERKQAFFDEQLHCFLLIELECNSGASEKPPKDLLTFLAHLQISLEASYISSEPTPTPDTPPARPTLLSAPPRSVSTSKLNPNADRKHPSILPPATPNPMPSSAEQDKRYIKAEGTLLNSIIWGHEPAEPSREAFSLLRSESKGLWIAVYKLSLTVSFLRVAMNDPLLCLTVSTTLREKPLPLTPKHPLAIFLASIGESNTISETPASTSAAINHHAVDVVVDPQLEGFEEVNLLEGLLGAPSFAPTDSSSRFSLPSSRIGPISRQKLFSLPAIVPPTPVAPSPSPMTIVRTTHHTLRKSYRKTLHTVSGFRVRMRTVFVPSVLLPSLMDRDDEDDGDIDPEEEKERREAGNEERTVVLCVEIENSGESGSNVGFIVEKVDVNVTGEGSKTILIGWGADFHHQKHPKPQHKHLQSTFPMVVGSKEQYNLLYAVSFLRSPEEVEGLMGISAPVIKATSTSGLAQPDPELSLQRAVGIVIYGKPCLRSTLSSVTSPISMNFPESAEDDLSYPTRTFSSRWNCVLDLSLPTSKPSRPHSQPDIETQSDEVHPAPASPFPVNVTSPPSNPSTSTLNARRSSALSPPSTLGSAVSQQMTPFTLSAGSKRHTMPSAGFNSPSRGLRSASFPVPPPNLRASTGVVTTRSTPTPPSVQIQIPKSPTTYDPPQSRPPSPPGGSTESIPPMTPAYPAWTTGNPNGHLPTPPTPMSQGPLASHLNNYIGPSVEIRRERGPDGFVGSYAPVPPTPGPVVGFGQGEGVFTQQQGQNSVFGTFPGNEDSSIVVSVGLLPLRKSADGGEPQHFIGKIHPLSYFTLDIFVFNRSERTRRFEVSCPDMRRQMRRMKKEAGDFPGMAYARGLQALSKEIRALIDDAGILPLDNRVRVGPLLPSACQSVRMEFIAVTPGVHTLEVLTFTDVESGFSMNLRNVMDIVVHEVNE